MRKVICLSWMLGAVALATGCSSTNVGVQAKHAPLAAYESEVGHLNTPAYALGDLVVLNPESKQARKALSVQVNPTDVMFTRAVEHETEPFTPAFDVAFSKSKAPAAAKEEVAETVRHQTTLHVENYSGRAIKAPAAFVSQDTRLTNTIAKIHAEDPKAKFFLVTSVVSADRVYLAGPTTLQEGKFQFHVSYPQNAELEQLVKDTPAFFKLTPLQLTNEEGRSVVVVDKDFSEKVATYRHPETFASGW